MSAETKENPEDYRQIQWFQLSPRRTGNQMILCIYATVAGTIAWAVIWFGGPGDTADEFERWQRNLTIVGICTMLAVAGSVATHLKLAVDIIPLETWIFQLGRGNLDFVIQPKGNDEIAAMARNLETLRQRSIEVVRLQLVEKLSAELEVSNTQLEKRNEELDEAMRQLREAQDQLVAHEKIREMSELAAGVAHEIRNPLNFVTNFCDGSTELLDELMEALDQEERDEDAVAEISSALRDNMNHIRRNVRRADRVLHGMISLGSSHGAWQEIDLNLVVRQSVQAALEAYATANGVAMPAAEIREDPANPQCLAISEGVGLALMALVQNACDATAEAGAAEPIVVSIQAGPEEASVTFRDEGCGMTPEILEKATTPLFTTKRGDNQGAGLGLTHAAEVARSHGGALVMTSVPGQGTTVTMTLRLRPPAAMPS